ncbi:polysaccharide pyruvyl transferase family protein [Bacteroides congonensis]|uniref:polysaccharide pyruvyl transferase family protein n=1 Tax=Bacteroides congonensis TaxID=1871006 RepID=UPI002666F972|nr:polysaccharide pyruvyl transferase family protein [Bacteroides congonensis]
MSNYDKVYTTRLHVAILSILLGKTFVFFDNSYGKNKFFYETWLKDIDDANFVD